MSINDLPKDIIKNLFVDYLWGRSALHFGLSSKKYFVVFVELNLRRKYAKTLYYINGKDANPFKWSNWYSAERCYEETLLPNGNRDGKAIITDQRKNKTYTNFYKNGKMNGPSITRVKGVLTGIYLYRNNNCISSFLRNNDSSDDISMKLSDGEWTEMIVIRKHLTNEIVIKFYKSNWGGSFLFKIKDGYLSEIIYSHGYYGDKYIKKSDFTETDIKMIVKYLSTIKFKR